MIPGMRCPVLEPDHCIAKQSASVTKSGSLTLTQVSEGDCQSFPQRLVVGCAPERQLVRLHGFHEQAAVLVQRAAGYQRLRVIRRQIQGRCETSERLRVLRRSRRRYCQTPDVLLCAMPGSWPA